MLCLQLPIQFEDDLVEFSDVPGIAMAGLEVDGAPADLNNISKNVPLRCAPQL